MRHITLQVYISTLDKYLEEGSYDDHRAPQELIVAYGRENKAYLGEVRPREVEERGNNKPPQHAAGHLRQAVLGCLKSLLENRER